MRRCVQVGMGLEFFGTLLAKAFSHNIDFTNFLSVSEQAMSNSHFVMVLHLGAMWWYQGYTRDHLMARHVTRIRLEKPLSEIGAEKPVTVWLETGPWTRRLEFRAGPGSGTMLNLGQLLRLGALHVDERRGEVLDSAALDLLTSGQMHIVSEELITDEEAKQRAFIGEYEVTELLQDDTSGSYEWLDDLPPILTRPLRWRGSSALRNFGIAALAMGGGSVVLWLLEGTVPRPSLFDRSGFLSKPKPASWY